MKIKLIALFVFILLYNPLSAQKHDYIWLSGYASFTPDSTYGRTVTDFNTSPPSRYREDQDPDISDYYAAICNAEGELQFYTNGCHIYGADHSIFPGGLNLNPGDFHDDWCINWGYYIFPGNTIILPTPEENIYYLIHKDIVSQTFMEPPYSFTYLNNLYYTKIEMFESGNTGTVLEKNVSLLKDTLMGSDLTAVKHANNQDWWFMAIKRETNRFFKFLLTADSIAGPFIQDYGEIVKAEGSSGGQAVFSPDGNTYVYYDARNDPMIYDFDRETGLLSNLRQFEIIDSSNVTFGGVSISPNSRFLYITNSSDLYQYDLWANDIAASEVHIAGYDGYLSPFPTNFFRMQLGPDCKIYMNSTNGVNVLHIIHYPDRKGLACEFEQHGVQLPTYNLFTLANNPHYRMGTDEICDSTISVSTTFSIPVLEDRIRLFPNPVAVEETIHLDIPKAVNGSFQLYNTIGNTLLEIDLFRHQNFYDISLPKQLSKGIYFYTIKGFKEGILESGKIVVE